MMISRDGIRREIDPVRLEEYRDKGYTVVQPRPEAERPEEQKPRTKK